MVATDLTALGEVCARLLGRPVVGVEAIAGGRNSQVFRVDCGTGAEPSRYVAKQYVARGEDGRDRLQTEYAALTLLRSHGIDNVPSPIAMDAATRCGVYEFVPGERASRRPPDAHDLRQAVDLLGRLKAIARHSDATVAGAASEACFSIDAIVANLAARVARLRSVSDGAPEAASLRRFLDTRFDPAVSLLDRWTDDEAGRAGIPRSFDLPFAHRTLSPSDFGFHNALRGAQGRLVFVDFEYFGWDDPAKTIVDFLHHPAMTMDDGQRGLFAAQMLAAFADDPDLAARARIVYPWFGLKWCVILLNEFVPEHLRRRRFAGVGDSDRAALLAGQLDRASELLDRVIAQYRHNAYFG